ncbi:MAG: chromosome segregation protein SMC [Bacillota bacterium]|nr:chromosome segregation protein SMC [Bacillota bacterium]
MYLKRLEIKGFKSFADRTELYLKSGLNIIVGPNGCGKSNVVDAIRWVLGESNVRHLRGQKNEDIIFNGSDKKKPQGMAVVEMTIDNADHALPVDFSEVNIVRKIFRTGESEFFINKNRVRMKDVVQLFTGTGMGKQGYSIISQGELEDVLNGQSFDRRLILEEAAGIIKYRHQRNEVQRRIIATSNDLIRVEDILVELETRREELGIKAEKAVKYKDLQTVFTTLEKTLLTSEIRSNGLQLKDKRKLYNQKGQEQEQLQKQVECLKNTVLQEEGQLEEIRQTVNKLIEQKHQLDSDIHAKESEIKLGEERIHNFEERMNNAGLDAEKYSKLIAELDHDLTGKIEDYNREEGSLKQRQSDLSELEKTITGKDNEINILLAQFEDHKSLVFEKAQREVEIKNQMIDQEGVIKKDQEKKERLLIHVQSNTDTLKLLKEQLGQMKEKQQTTEEQIQALQREQIDMQNEMVTFQEQKKNLEDKLGKDQREQFSMESKLQALRDLEKNYSGYSEGVRALVKSHQQRKKSLQGMVGIVGELINVPQGMEMAIDVAVGKGLENIIIHTAQEAKKAIDYLKRNSLGRATFLPLDVLRTQTLSPGVIQDIKKNKGVLGIASELIEYDPGIARAVDYLFGRVLIVENMDCGLNVFKNTRASVRIVTLEGELINVSGAMTGGAHSKRRSSPLQRKGEEKALHQRLQILSAGKNKNEGLLRDTSAKYQEMNERYSELKNHLSELMFQKEMLEQEYGNVQNTIENNQTDSVAYQREISQLENSMHQQEQIRFNLQGQFETVHLENFSFSEDVEGLKENIELLRRNYAVNRERYHSQQESLIMKKRELETLQTHIQQFTQVRESYQQSLGEAESLLQQCKTGIEQQRLQIESGQKIRVTTHGSLAAVRERLMNLQEQEKQVSMKLEKLRNSLLPAQRQLDVIEQNLRSIEMRMIRIETEMEGLENRWREKFGAELWEQESEILKNAELREYKNRMESLQREINMLGSVDLEAIEEYEKCKARYDFLRTQSNDLKEAQESLQRLLGETEKIMSNQFHDFVKEANNSFQYTFTEIFGGGEAALIVEEDEDPFSSGIDIAVKMPGKRMQSLNLLSGGERALTCIAFVFSLLRLKPSPFCLLDEIDAALDETNLLRFSGFIKRMSTEMQFIIITHRQATIEAGEMIYGVTMPQEGISSILSLNFEDVESIAG